MPTNVSADADEPKEPDMTDVSTFEDIAMSADTVRSVIGDIAGIRSWAVLVQSESVEDTPSGKVRTLVMSEDRVVKERLVVQSQYSYTYAMVDRPEMADYRSTVAVVPLDDQHCRIELIMHMTPAVGQTEDEITTRCTRNLRGNLRAMKKALGLPL
jgi:Polyketide cyclase / dehydrase and lipid transport